MNNELFEQARANYASNNFEGALAGYSRCLQDVSHPLAPGEMGLLYHQIGNCLVKLKNPGEAIHAYSQAAADTAYDACGAVNCNLGMTYASMHDYDNAIKHFEIAVSDAKYNAAYKAYMGMGNALLKLGKSAEAGVAFREAALDEDNPDPTKALLNLGVCFMALDRPADAVASYESALQFDMPSDTKNRLEANLGQAYVACGQMQNAVNAFEQSLEDKTYFLSDSASVDYQRAIAAVSQGTSEVTQVIAPTSPSADMSGLDVAADGSTVYANEDPYAGQSPYYYADMYGQNAYGQNAYGQLAYDMDNGDDRFFNASDQEIEQWSRGLAKQDRKRRNVGLRVLLVIVIIVVILVAAAAFLYTQGYGIPTQESVIEEMFADPDNAEVYSADVSDEKLDTIQSIVTKDTNVSIDGINRSMNLSTAYATATTSEGGQVTYEISLVRDLIGWKISNVELYFASQN